MSVYAASLKSRVSVGAILLVNTPAILSNVSTSYRTMPRSIRVFWADTLFLRLQQCCLLFGLRTSPWRLDEHFVSRWLCLLFHRCELCLSRHFLLDTSFCVVHPAAFLSQWLINTDFCRTIFSVLHKCTSLCIFGSCPICIFGSCPIGFCGTVLVDL